MQPAAAYELLTNIALLALMLYLARQVRRPGVLMLVYLYSYAFTQLLLFFVRDNLVVSFLGLNWGLKQAQWTSIVVLLLLLPVTFFLLRRSKSVPPGEVAATYGIAQQPMAEEQARSEPPEGQVSDTDGSDMGSSQVVTEEA